MTTTPTVTPGGVEDFGEECTTLDRVQAAGSVILVDADDLRAAGYEVTDEAGVPVTDIALLEDPLLVRAPGATASVRVSDGWQALAFLDRNSDGVLTSADPAFSALRAWKDDDADGTLDATEVRTLADARVGVVDLACPATSPATPTPPTNPSGTPVGATPTPGEQEPEGPIPAPGLALLLAGVAAIAVLWRRR